MHWAAMYGRCNVIEYLYDHVENINPETSQKMTPLHLAAREGHFDTVIFLRDFSDDPNPKTITGTVFENYSKCRI